MHIFIDESVHDELGFMLLGFVVCRFDPQQRLETILRELGLPEYHSLDRMERNKQAQALRMRRQAERGVQWKAQDAYLRQGKRF